MICAFDHHGASEMRQKSSKRNARAGAASVEISPQGAAVAESLGRRVEASGGAALVVDYGNPWPAEDSLRRASPPGPARYAGHRRGGFRGLIGNFRFANLLWKE